MDMAESPDDNVDLTRRCLFCDTPGSSREHMFGDWLGKLIEIPNNAKHGRMEGDAEGYTTEYDQAERLHWSLWLAELRGPAEDVRDIVVGELDGDDSVAVIELRRDVQWAAIRALEAGVDWLRRHIPFRAG